MNYQLIILNFLKAYKVWVAVGAPKHEYFLVEHGLCSNLCKYIRVNHTTDEDVVWATTDTLATMFRADDLSALLPFNRVERGQPAYSKEVHHENPWRIQWVTNTINKLEGKFK